MVWDEETEGQRIKRLREEQKLTQEKLGRIVDLSEQTINRIETGVVRQLGEFRERLSRALGVSLDYLLQGHPYAERETMRAIASLRTERPISADEASQLRVMASQALKLRNNAKVPLSPLEIQSLLMVIRGQ